MPRERASRGKKLIEMTDDGMVIALSPRSFILGRVTASKGRTPVSKGSTSKKMSASEDLRSRRL